jgi:hypothetical protein
MMMGIAYTAAIFLLIIGLSCIINKETNMGILLILIAVITPFVSTLLMYPIFALSQIESNTAETNKKLDQIIELLQGDRVEAEDDVDADWGTDKDEERPEPLYDEFRRF